MKRKHVRKTYSAANAVSPTPNLDSTRRLAVVLGLACLGSLSFGCGEASSGDESTSTGVDTTSAGVDTGVDAEGEAGTGDTSGTTTSTSGVSTSGGSGFVDTDSAATCGSTCDIWAANDCDAGQKCTAVGCAVGTTAWDANVCRDVQGTKQIGDDCEYLGSGIDGNDDCGEGTMCWNQDADSGLGMCVAFCTGSPAAPTCATPTLCVIANDGVLPICLSQCDPLSQDCPGSDLCVPDFDDNGFVCVLDASGGMAPYGSPCNYANGCNAGLVCTNPAAVPEPACATAAGCCSPMCDLTEPNTCPGAGQECQALYQAGLEPPGFDHMGVCAVPA